MRLAIIQTGKEKDGYIEVVSGIGFADRIVIENVGVLYDSCEVIM